MASSSVFSSNKSAIDPDPSVIGGGGSTPPVHPNNDWTARYPYASGDYTNNLVGASLTNNGTTPTVDGVRGDVAGFDGIDDFFSDAYMGNSSGAASWSTWFNTNTTIGMLFGSTLTANNYILLNSATQIIVRVSGTQLMFTVPTISTSDLWYNVQVTRSASDDFNLYLNSIISSTGALNDSGTIVMDAIGKRSSGLFFDGLQDLNTYWDRELSQSDVTANYNFELLA